MASDHREPSRRKHRRNSDKESEKPSKRHKHRHHHHRHKCSRKQVENGIKQGEEFEVISRPSPPPLAVAVALSNGDWRPNYDMEEGEIVDDDEDFDIENKAKPDSSDENMKGVRGALDGTSLSVEDQNVKLGSNSMMLDKNKGGDAFKDHAVIFRKKNISDNTKILDGVDLQRNSSMEDHVNGDIIKEGKNRSLLSSSPEGLAKRKGYYSDESEFSGQSKSLFPQTVGKRHKSLGSSPSNESHYEEYRSTNRSGSRDQARERSRSQSILQDVSLLQTHQRDTAYLTERKQMRDKERERSSCYSRHTVRVDRYQNLENRDGERSQEACDGDGEQRQMYRDNSKRENVCDRERVRERDRNRERERGRRESERGRRRERERDGITEKESGRGNRHHKHRDVDVGYVDRDRHNDYRHRRLDQTEHRERSRKNDPEKVCSSKNDHSERDTKRPPIDDGEQEDYQERIVLQLAEQEEEDLNRIKEESRRLRQAILAKYKIQQSQQNHEPNLEDTVRDPNVVAETHSGQNEAADMFLTNASFSPSKSPDRNESPVLKICGTGTLGEGTPKSERLADLFRDDIFGDSPAGVRKQGKGDGLTIERSGLHDNWDDAEGYYRYRFGEVLDARYEVIAAHGKGVYSNVVRAKDLKAGSGDPDEVAIKIIRSNDTMYKAGLEELAILKKLVGADQEDRRHCVRFLSSFKYRNHLCLVFESLHMNLREVLKKFGRNIGIKLTAVRAYAKQLFIALKHLRNCGVLHSDIKPDNMLVNEAKNVLKLSDFGNAMFAGKNEITPYLVSRFYRAPEIILGLPYDHPMDIWSVGCCLFELYTGRVLFPGPSNNDLLRLHMELKGPFPKKMLRKGAFTDQHFDQDLNFLATEEDPVTKKAIKRLILNIKPKEIGSIVLGSAGDDPKMLANFKDLLEKIFVLDPAKRITVSQALSHLFITGK